MDHLQACDLAPISLLRELRDPAMLQLVVMKILLSSEQQVISWLLSQLKSMSTMIFAWGWKVQVKVRLYGMEVRACRCTLPVSVPTARQAPSRLKRATVTDPRVAAQVLSLKQLMVSYTVTSLLAESVTAMRVPSCETSTLVGAAVKLTVVFRHQELEQSRSVKIRMQYLSPSIVCESIN